MGKGLRITLWILSSLAVLWTLLALVGLLRMGGMMGSRMMSQGMMGGPDMMEWSPGMMLPMLLTWLIVLGLDGAFVYLIASAGRRGAAAG
jgi:hypothetical protein